MQEIAVTPRVLRFGPLSIEYDERVLTPRPWTEQQSQWAADLLASLPPGPVLELCAGPGHIGLLALVATDRRLVQVDADAVACAYARRNADRAGMGDRVEVRQGVLEEALDPDERFALVLADPPWVPSSLVVEHPDDPVPAIDGGPDGLALARTCLEVASRHLVRTGAALLQVGGLTQVRAVERHVAARLPTLVAEGHRVADGGAVVHLTRTPRLTADD